MTIDYKSNIWCIPYINKSQSESLNINFNKIDNLSLRAQAKEIIYEILKKESLSIGSITAYMAKLTNYFLPFLKEQGIELNSFSELTKEIINAYTLHLLGRDDVSKYTKILAVVSIKSLVSFGNLYRIKNMPSDYIFEKNYSDIFGIDDVLETKAISKEDMNIINKNIQNIENLFLKAALVIARDTGLRIGAILDLQKGCILEDLVGHPVIYCYSHKDDEELYNVATQDIKECIKVLEERMPANKGEYLFYEETISKKRKTHRYTQRKARKDLQAFLEKIGLGDRNITFHSFRHTLGTEMLNNGATTEQVSTQLHHKSLHNTNIYARMHDKTVENEYRKMRVLGLESIDDSSMESNTTGCEGALPDGKCKQFIQDNGEVCPSFNRCLLCSSFKTFAEDLPTHENHLKRIQEDTYKYMQEEAIPTFEILEKIEERLKQIIAELKNDEF